MEKIKKILVPVDFSANSKHGLKYALNLCKDQSIILEVLHVINPIYNPLASTESDNSPTKKAVGEAVLNIKSFLNEVFAETGSTHVRSTTTNIEIGKTADVICRIAKRDEIDLIIMSTKGYRSSETNFLGSISTAVLKKSKVGILFIPEYSKIDKIKRAVYTTSFENSDPIHIWKATKLLFLSKLKIDCIHINKETGKSYYAVIEEFEKYFKENNPNIEVDFKVLRDDDFTRAILDYAKSNEADLIISTRKKDQIPASFLGKSLVKEIKEFSHYPILVLPER